MKSPINYVVERKTRASQTGMLIALLGSALLVSLPFWAEASLLRFLVEAMCYLVLAQMWNLLAGYGGLISIGQQAFVGIGAYGLFLAANHLGINPFISIFLGGLIAAIIAVPTAAVVFRLKGGYFAVGTWVVAEVYRLGASNITLLGGGSGQSLTAMRGIPKATRESVTFWIAVAITIGFIGLMYWLLRSRFGMALTAIRDSEAASESQGINVNKVKFYVFILAAFGTGLVGALYYLNALRISPTAAFDLNWVVFPIFIVVIGGIGTIEGPIIGTLVFFGMRSLLADYGSWYLMVLGLVAIVIMMKWPKGIWGTIQQRYNLRFFPVQRRVVLTDQSLKPDSTMPAAEPLSKPL
ncbi:branched-chain amino acid ABC transporter permease [Eoetvoesiella caeni]|uniref:Amino acid/amide ABC transporter membrane protein 2 (HAAT family) n=1 Tax=Eoetvoesiella caeni TaxID=645616 RepID=A0A366H2N3_9BURK|nr:branched-chain amino acid ABC transporter permease [Eoetvoesiella caeni]MCI2810563.1 branched-chain amino acid ABC transporter permease [Eoetvoesiella caeni]NYT56652.1 branched-chain amino acid ABC transporter permease [Eoetvoesiella caeni]RBP36184.1 amino acid/amide ABC transporter membrane protein 2 (HAAT family) [Eoetvoesiella caeni]